MFRTEKPSKLLTPQAANMKTDKNVLPTWSLSLAPGNLSGHEVCPHRTAGCTAACVAKSGNATVFPRVMQARIRKTQYFFKNRAEFIARLIAELKKADAQCKRDGTLGLVRLNTFSDIAWECIIDLGSFENLRFYDYTKSVKRAMQSAQNDVRFMRPDGTKAYRLCYSANENSNDKDIHAILDAGGTVAVVFGDIKYNAHTKGPMHPTYKGYPTIDGDLTDDRYNDAGGHIVGLRLKGTNAMRESACSSNFARTAQLTVRGAAV